MPRTTSTRICLIDQRFLPSDHLHAIIVVIHARLLSWQMCSPGGCLKRGRRTYLGLGSRRRFPQSHLPRSFWPCHFINSLIWFTCLGCLSFLNYLSASGYIWALHDPGHPLPMQSRILGCLWRRHTSGSVVQNLGINYFRISPRCTNDFRMILRPSLLWWREGEGITTISTRRTLLAALIYECCTERTH